MLLHKGETLFRQGEIGPLFRIKSGLLKIVRVHEDGHPFLFNLVIPGEVIPHHSLLSPKEYHGTAIALLPTEVERLSPKTWYDELQMSPERTLEVARLLQSRLRTMQQRIDQLTPVTPAEKLDKLLEWLDEYIPKDIKATDLLTQEDIAQLIGVRRETVNRLLRAKASLD